MPRGLTREEIETFHKEGCLVVEDLFSESDLLPVIDEISDEILVRARRLAAEGKLRSTYEQLGFERQLAAIDQEADTLLPEISSGALSGPEIFRLIIHPKLLDIAESLCGPELIASSVYRLRPKLPHDPRGEVPWHQDSGYFDPACDKGLILTVWLPLVDASADNGCLYVLPRLHKSEVFSHWPNKEGTYLEIKTKDYPSKHKAVAVPVRKGSVLLMTNRTPHASFENKGNTVRWSMDLRYQSANLPNNAAFSRRESGFAESGRESVPPACYPPSADFLARSQNRPSDVLSDAKIFNRKRVEYRANFERKAASSRRSNQQRKVAINSFSLERWS